MQHRTHREHHLNAMRCNAIWFDSILFDSMHLQQKYGSVSAEFELVCVCVCCLCTVLLLRISCMPHITVRWNCWMPCCMVCSFHCSKLSMLNIQCSTFNWVSFLFIVYRLLCLPILGGSLSIFYYAFRVPYFRCFAALSSPCNSLLHFPIIVLLLSCSSFSFVCRSSETDRADIKRFNFHSFITNRPHQKIYTDLFEIVSHAIHMPDYTENIYS